MTQPIVLPWKFAKSECFVGAVRGRHDERINVKPGAEVFLVYENVDEAIC